MSDDTDLRPLSSVMDWRTLFHLSPERRLSPEQMAAADLAERVACREAHEAAQIARTGEFLHLCGLEADEIDLLTGKTLPPRGAMLAEVDAREAAAAFMADPRLLFLRLMGKSGTGKTLAAAHALMASGQTSVADRSFDRASWGWRWRTHGLLITAPDLSHVPPFGEETVERLRQLASVPLLVLDDLGRERLTVVKVLDDLVDLRMRRRLKTIITTNLDEDAFRTKYDARTVDRLSHGDASRTVVCYSVDGASLRAKAAE